MQKTAGEDKMLGFGSKFHMNAFPFSVHYDGNGPYHSICFALELSSVIYVPQVQIFHVTIRNVGGIRGLNTRDLCTCGPCVCVFVCVGQWQGTCGSASV